MLYQVPRISNYERRKRILDGVMVEERRYR